MVKMDYNSIVNQEIKSKLVSRDVYICLTSEVGYILRKSFEDTDTPFTYEDVEKLFIPYCKDCGEGYTSFTEKEWWDMTDKEQSRCLDQQGHEINAASDEEDRERRDKEREAFDDDGGTFFICDGCGKIYSDDEYSELDTESQEVYEWWAVSSMLGRELLSMREVVIPGGWGNWYWGRCATGQAIKLDHTISVIAERMRILDGQVNSWAS